MARRHPTPSNPSDVEPDKPATDTVGESPAGAPSLAALGPRVEQIGLPDDVIAICRQHDFLTLRDLSETNLATLLRLPGINRGHAVALAMCVSRHLPPAEGVAGVSCAIPAAPSSKTLFRPVLATLDTGSYFDRCYRVLARYPLRWITDGRRSSFESDRDEVHDLTLDQIRRSGFRAIQVEAGWAEKDAYHVRRLISFAIAEVMYALQDADRARIDRWTFRSRLENPGNNPSAKARTVHIWNDYREWCMRQGLPFAPTYDFVIGQYFAQQGVMKSRQRLSLIAALVAVSKADGGQLTEGSVIFRAAATAMPRKTAPAAVKTFAPSVPRPPRKAVAPTMPASRPADPPIAARMIDLGGYERYQVSSRRRLPANAQGIRDDLTVALNQEAGLTAEEIVSIQLESLTLTDSELAFTVQPNTRKSRRIRLRAEEYPLTHRLCGAWITIAGIQKGPLIRNMRNSIVYDFGIFTKSLQRNLSFIDPSRVIRTVNGTKPLPGIFKKP